MPNLLPCCYAVASHLPSATIVGLIFCGLLYSQNLESARGFIGRKKLLTLKVAIANGEA
jgi:hypothetical protein